MWCAIENGLVNTAEKPVAIRCIVPKSRPNYTKEASYSCQYFGNRLKKRCQGDVLINYDMPFGMGSRRNKFFSIELFDANAFAVYEDR